MFRLLPSMPLRLRCSWVVKSFRAILMILALNECQLVPKKPLPNRRWGVGQRRWCKREIPESHEWAETGGCLDSTKHRSSIRQL